MQELIKNATLSVATSSTVAALEQFNSKRTLISFVNTSTTAGIYLSIGEEAVVGRGFYMAPGGYYIDSADGINYPSNKQYNLIADAASATVSVQERVVVRS